MLALCEIPIQIFWLLSAFIFWRSLLYLDVNSLTVTKNIFYHFVACLPTLSFDVEILILTKLNL